MANGCANNGSTLPHEVGHFYGLPHTHDQGNELVNGSNCATAGDNFCDTPADPNLSGVVNSSCVYTGTATDANVIHIFLTQQTLCPTLENYVELFSLQIN